jgi:2-keto-3-deoxy-L-rhamnonate aldolase RhmA
MQEKLARGEVALCMATRLARTADIAMIADACGFDAFYVDMEHCTISLDDTAQICVAALPIGSRRWCVSPVTSSTMRHACSMAVRSASSARM